MDDLRWYDGTQGGWSEVDDGRGFVTVAEVLTVGCFATLLSCWMLWSMDGRNGWDGILSHLPRTALALNFELRVGLAPQLKETCSFTSFHPGGCMLGRRFLFASLRGREAVACWVLILVYTEDGQLCQEAGSGIPGSDGILNKAGFSNLRCWLSTRLLLPNRSVVSAPCR